MNTKMPKMKSLQEVLAGNYLPSRSAMTKPDELYVINIRPGLIPSELPKPRIVIPILMRDFEDKPAQPVKITHL